MLGDAIEGAIHTPQAIRWIGFDLSGGTLSGRIRGIKPVSVVRDIKGALAFTDDGTDGEFAWAYDVDDLVLGEFEVQFKCAYVGGTYDLTEPTEFRVLEAI